MKSGHWSLAPGLSVRHRHWRWSWRRRVTQHLTRCTIRLFATACLCRFTPHRYIRVRVSTKDPSGFRQDRLTHMSGPRTRRRNNSTRYRVRVLARLLTMTCRRHALTTRNVLLTITVIIRRRRNICNRTASRQRRRRVRVRHVNLRMMNTTCKRRTRRRRRRCITPTPVKRRHNVRRDGRCTRRTRRRRFPTSIKRLPPSNRRRYRPYRTQRYRYSTSTNFRNYQHGPAFNTNTLQPRPIFPAINPFLRIRRIISGINNGLRTTNGRNTRRNKYNLRLSITRNGNATRRCQSSNSHRHLKTNNRGPYMK